MITSFVVRLVLDNLDRGEFTGEVQHVATGRRSLVHSGEELLGELRGLGSDGTVELRVEQWSSDGADEANPMARELGGRDE